MSSIFVIPNLNRKIVLNVEEMLANKVIELLSPYIFAEEDSSADTVFSVQAVKVSSEEYTQLIDVINYNSQEQGRIFNYNSWSKLNKDKYLIHENYSNNSMIVCDLTTKTIIFKYTDYLKLSYDITRFIRNYFYFGLKFNSLPIHGAVINEKSNGILFTGDKFSGKSSSMLHFVKNYRSEFITNDISLFNGKRFVGVGKSVSIRKISFDKFKICDLTSRYPFNIQSDNNISWDSKFKLSPKEFVHYFNTAIRKSAEINIVFYLNYCKNSNSIDLIECKNEKKALIERQIIDLKYYCPFLKTANSGIEHLLYYLDDFVQNIVLYNVYMNENNQNETMEMMYQIIDNRIRVS